VESVAGRFEVHIDFVTDKAGTSRCDVPAHIVGGRVASRRCGTRTAQRAVPTTLR
jgi:hypothetical protein